MTTERQVCRQHTKVGLRPLRYLGFAFLALALDGRVLAEEQWPSSPIGPTMDNRLSEAAWYGDDPVIRGESTVDTDTAPLADRVAALEKYISDQKAEEESLPAAQEVCKQVDITSGPTYKLRGRIFFDGVMYDDDNATAAFFPTEDRENEFGFDTARLGLEGLVYENLAYTIEVEFEGTEVDFKDVFLEYQSLPVIGNIRAGHFKEPIGLEELTSSRFDTFMEQSYATSTFAPARNFGIMVFNHIDACQDATWFLGAFRNDSDDSPSGSATSSYDGNDWSLASRLAWLPYYDEPSGGRYLVHLGASYSYRNTTDTGALDSGLAEFTTGAWVGNQPPIGVGAQAASDEWQQVGLEAAVVWGALSVQAEYFQAFVTSGEQYNGAYVEFSYFLTGEHRGYKKATKAFDRVHPYEPAFWVDTCRGWCCGRGAWELTAGYSFVDLEDGADINPGILERAFVDGAIVGVNWYLNPYSRVMFNYNLEITDFVDSGTPDSTANLFGVRWQADW